jgi:hypothetical protein
MIRRATGLVAGIAQPLIDLAPGFIEPALRFIAGLFQVALQLLAALAGLLPGPSLILTGTPAEHAGKRENHRRICYGFHI